jgi:hypothetical protein
MRIRVCFLFLFLWGCCAAPVLRAQSVVSLVHVDRPFYVNGEVIWYKLYLPTRMTNQPFTVRMDVMDSQGERVDYVYLRSTVGRMVDGYYAIPYDAREGWYQLRFVAWIPELEVEETVGSIRIPIYNDLTESPAGTMVEEARYAGAVEGVKSQLQVELELLTPNPRPGDRVRARLRVKDPAGDPVAASASIAVTDRALTQTDDWFRGTVFTRQFFPRYNGIAKGMVLTGRIEQEKGAPFLRPVLAAWSPAQQQVFYANTKVETGAFALELPDFTGTQDLQFMEIRQDSLAVYLEPPGTPFQEQLPVNDLVRRYQELSALRKRIYQLENQTEYFLPPQRILPDTVELVPNETVDFSRYQQFKDVYTFFREVRTTLEYSTRGDRYSARIYNPAIDKYNPGPPIFILDGKVTRDADYIGRLPTSELERVEIFYRQRDLLRQFSALGNYGVVILHSIDGNLDVPASETADIRPINGYQSPAEFPVLDPADRSLPLLRPTLFWDPQVAVGADGTAEIEWIQTDDLSSFRIEVLVQDEWGLRGQVEATYQSVAGSR